MHLVRRIICVSGVLKVVVVDVSGRKWRNSSGGHVPTRAADGRAHTHLLVREPAEILARRESIQTVGNGGEKVRVGTKVTPLKRGKTNTNVPHPHTQCTPPHLHLPQTL